MYGLATIKAMNRKGARNNYGPLDRESGDRITTVFPGVKTKTRKRLLSCPECGETVEQVTCPRCLNVFKD
jgi:hypothetical protein